MIPAHAVEVESPRRRTHTTQKNGLSDIARCDFDRAVFIINSNRNHASLTGREAATVSYIIRSLFESRNMMRALAMLGFIAMPIFAGELTATVDATSITFRDGESLITAYVHAGTVKVEKGEGTKPLAKPYFYPVHAPGGIKVTRDWPMVRGTTGETVDHFHQKSAWFCHGDVIPEGVTIKTRSADKHVKGVDFWSEAAGHGRIVCTNVGTPKTSNGIVRVETVNEWRTPDDVVILNEVRIVSVAAATAGYRIAIESKLSAAVARITFGDTKEGSFGVRVPDGMRLNGPASTGIITTAAGRESKAPAKDNLPLWGQHDSWNDYSGTIAGKTAGIAVMAHASNPLPSAWHTRAYGLMAANPFARSGSGFPAVKGKTDLCSLAKGDAPLTLRFAMYAHTGDANSAAIANVYADYVK
jgi:hypothetical protein